MPNVKQIWVTARNKIDKTIYFLGQGKCLGPHFRHQAKLQGANVLRR